ncbi:MAG: response regulator [Acidobacteriota bacterium]
MKRVLVVDDDQELAAAIVDFLRAEGIPAEAAFDRATAAVMLQRDFYPVVLADLRLHTQEDGLLLVEDIGRLTPRTGVATITGEVDALTEMRLQELGSRTVLLKPVDPMVIVTLVREMLAEIEAAAMLGPADDIDALYASVTPVLRSIARRRYGFAGDEIDDIVQQAWVIYAEKRAMIRSVRSWLVGTVANLCRQQIQQHYRHRTVEIDEADQTVLPSSFETSIALQQALALLDGRGREICMRVGLARQTYEEVSVAMNLPIGSIGPLFVRAKSKMRGSLSSQS